MNRQKLLLSILVGILALSLAYAFWASPRQRRAPASGPRPPASPRPAPSAEAPAQENRLHLELLAREEEFPGFERDIFRFTQPAPRPLPAPPVAKAPPPPPPPAPPAVTSVMEEVQRELARFTFLGFLQKEGVKTIFLSSGGEIFVVKKGDRFGQEKKFFVADLTPGQLTIRQNDDPRPIIIPLVEQAPLAPGPQAPFRGPSSPPLRPPMPFRGPARFPGAGEIRQPVGPAAVPPAEAEPMEDESEEEPEEDEVPAEQPPAGGAPPATPEAAPNEVRHD